MRERAARVGFGSLCVLGLLDALCVPARAAAAPTEYQVKAVFLFNFARFVDWPATAFANAEAPFAICVYGDDPFGPDLERLVHGQSVAGRSMVSRHTTTPVDLASCQIAFIAGSARTEFGAIVEGLRGRPVLTVSDIEGAARRGVMIRFLTAHDRVRLRVNLAAVRAGHLTVSSNLLRAAEIVGDAAAEGAR